MFDNRGVLGLIPARGGSKGLHRKNVRDLSGKPLIAWTIEQALQSRYLDRVVVSTEDEEIAAVARECGAEVPFIRPIKLATDAAEAADVAVHALETLRRDGFSADSLVLLQPTSPLRRVEDIDGAITRFYDEGGDTLVSVSPMKEHPYKCIRPQDGGWRYLASPPGGSPCDTTRRQEYDERFFCINGAVYIVKSDFMLQNKKFAVENETILYVMPAARGMDIDDEFDFLQAETYCRHRDSLPL